MAVDAGEQETEPTLEETAAPPGRRDRVLVYLTEHQAKGQFVQMARRLIETGILKPSALDLAKKYDDMAPRQIEWSSIRRHVNRLSIRDLTAAIIPALYAYPGAVLIAVDDMTSLTPTQQAFWLAVFEHAQVVTCASDRKHGLRKLWWKMKPIAVPALEPEAARAIVRDAIARAGLLIEAPELYVGCRAKWRPTRRSRQSEARQGWTGLPSRMPTPYPVSDAGPQSLTRRRDGREGGDA